MNADTIRDALAARIQKELELASAGATDELRVALEDLARDTAAVYLRQLAGEKVDTELAAIKARVVLLKSASVLTGVGALQDALWQATVSAFHAVTSALQR